MIKVLIADDRAVVRPGIKQIICTLPVATQVTEAETFDDAITMIEERAFDLLVPDINVLSPAHSHSKK